MMLIFDDALTAHPFALRRGAIFLRRSFIHAIIMAGPEIARSTPAKARITCHHAKAKIPLARLARAVPIIPRAIPKAAKIPANLPMSKGCASAGFAAAPAAGAAAGAALIFSVASFIILASLSAAFLLMRFSITVAILRYGDQNAWEMLIGFSMILVMTASHSTPLLS